MNDHIPPVDKPCLRCGRLDRTVGSFCSVAHNCGKLMTREEFDLYEDRRMDRCRRMYEYEFEKQNKAV